MESHPNLIVMLTHQDHTVENAAAIFERCRNARAQYWGFKESGLPLPQMKALFRRMQECGKKTALEVVAYTEPECLQGARMAAECGCDLLMGTVFSDAVNRFCQEQGLRYLPFVGTVTGRPSVLSGSAKEMIRQAREYLQKGAYGIDLLGYRYTGNKSDLIRQFVAEVDAPVCVAGSIDSLKRLEEIRRIGPWAFTIGGAFFEHRFGQEFCRQIDRVADVMQGDAL